MLHFYQTLNATLLLLPTVFEFELCTVLGLVFSFGTIWDSHSIFFIMVGSSCAITGDVLWRSLICDLTSIIAVLIP